MYCCKMMMMIPFAYRSSHRNEKKTQNVLSQRQMSNIYYTIQLIFIGSYLKNT